jgi:hypothetical protein
MLTTPKFGRCVVLSSKLSRVSRCFRQQILATADRSSRLTSVDFAAFCVSTASIFACFRVSFRDRMVGGAAPVPNTKTPKLAAKASSILRLSELLT